MSDEFFENNLPEFATQEEQDAYYEQKYAWLDEMSHEELNDYLHEQSKKNTIYIKSSEDGHSDTKYSEKSPLHRDNPYYQKIVVRWDWVEIEGIVDSSNISNLDKILNSIDLHANWHRNSHIYNLKEDYNFYKPDAYSRFRVKVSNHEGDKRVILSIASTILNDAMYIERFKDIRSFMKSNTIKIRRIDLSFLILMDLSKINLGLKYSKTQSITRNTDTNNVETITLGTYTSNVKATLYNKKIQIKDRHKKKKLENVEHLYNFELTIKGNKENKWDISQWRTVLTDRVSLSQDMLANYWPSSTKDFAYMYLYINDKALFKERYLDKDLRRMRKHLKELQNSTNSDSNDNAGIDYVPLLQAVLDAHKERLSDEIYELTTIRI